MNATAETMRLAALGMPELVRLALRGKLRGRHLGLAIEGAERYNRMVAAGDVASEGDQAERVRSGCSRCPHATRHGFTVLGIGRLKWYCGEPFEPDASKGTCGCPTGATTSRAAVKAGTMEHPAGRLMVASLGCEAGMFGAVQRAEV